MLKPLLFIAEFCRRNKKKGLNMKVITMESSAFTDIDGTDSEDRRAHPRGNGDKKRKRETEDRLLTTRRGGAPAQRE